MNLKCKERFILIHIIIIIKLQFKHIINRKLQTKFNSMSAIVANLQLSPFYSLIRSMVANFGYVDDVITLSLAISINR